MRPQKQRDLQPSDLAEVEREIEMWRSKAAELWPSVAAFAFALRTAASQIVFKGDLIVFRSLENVGYPTVDLAAIRKIVCNLKILQTQREQLEARKRREPNRDRIDDQLPDTRLGDTDIALRPPRIYL